MIGFGIGIILGGFAGHIASAAMFGDGNWTLTAAFTVIGAAIAIYGLVAK